MTSYVSQVSESSLVKGSVCILGNLTTHVRAREAALWTDAETIRGETPETEDADDTRRKRLNRARMAVTRNMPECLTTFRLVIKNGTNRKESIWELMKGQPNGTRRNTATVHN